MLDLNQLRVFVETAKEHSMKIASQTLGVSLPAVSQSIKNLEEQLGEKLFLRDMRPMKLTSAGRYLLGEAQELIRNAEDIESHFVKHHGVFKGLRLGLGETMSGTVGPWLTSALMPYAEQLTVHTQLTRPLLMRLNSDDLDVLIAPFFFMDKKDTFHDKLLAENYLFVSHRSIPLPTSKADISSLAKSLLYVSYGHESSDRIQTDRYLYSLGVTPRKRIDVSTSYMLIGLVAVGKGWCIVPALNVWCGAQFIRDIHFCLLPGSEEFQRIMCVSGARHKHEEKVKLVSSVVRRILRTYMFKELEKLDPELEKSIKILSG